MKKAQSSVLDFEEKVTPIPFFLAALVGAIAPSFDLHA